MTDLMKTLNKQYEKLLVTMKELFGFGLEMGDTNIFYDKDAGFTVIDITDPPKRSFDEKSKGDINELISRADSAIGSLYHFSSWMGEKMPPENQFEDKFITYRLLKVAKSVIPALD